MKKIFLFFLLLGFVCANTVPIPPKLSQSQKGDVVKSIKYHNIIYISEVIANEIANIPTGEKLDYKRLDKAIRAFYNQGYFEDVWVSFDSGVLNFYFKEKPRIGSIEVKGYGSESDRTALIEQLGLKRGDMFDSLKLDKAKQTIKAVLEQKGYYGSVVEFQSESIAQSNAYNLKININQGNEITIQKAIYEGRKELSVRDIEALSANKERDFMGWMWGLNDGKLHLGELEYDPLRIQDAYMRKGFLDAQVSSPFLSVNFNDYNAKLFYKITEGTRYKVSGVEIVLETPVISEDQLYTGLKIKKGEYFDVQALRADMDAIKTKVADIGYPFANVNPDLDKSDGEVKVIYYVSVGKKVYINDVIISGNTRTSDRIIRREIALAPGDLYNLTKVRESENALRRLGFFESVRIDTRRISEDSMDLLVSVVETRTGELMFGLGYGSYDKITVNASVRERNLFGTGNSGQVYMDISKTRQMYNIGLTNPRIFDSRFSFSFEVFRSSYVDWNYTENNTGFSTSVGRLLTNTLRFSLALGVGRTNIADFAGGTESFYRTIFTNPNPWKISLTPSLSFDNTDDYYFPKNGIIASTYLEYAGLGGDENYTKLYGKFAFYHYLKKWIPIDLIARYKAQAGYVFEEGYTPINNLFSMGGISTVRGYQSGSLSPAPIGADGLYVGGNYMFTNSVELSYGILESLQMRLSVFYDFGIIGNHKRNFPYALSTDPIMRQSAGLALEWVSPIGPIVLVFPWAIKPHPNDKTSNFEFTMGTRF
ncbi:outer membrane protein assembly factor BamA [Helicobacter pametensis]|uniref:outer membrane protein assembly factor BamA n=1 Tax=Helicobacter pametensis TaxID=95149 RepID=UPI001F3EADC3|nr:outer membrane protein assembly factor BamA [Helicobacter pametensis]